MPTRIVRRMQILVAVVLSQMLLIISFVRNYAIFVLKVSTYLIIRST